MNSGAEARGAFALLSFAPLTDSMIRAPFASSLALAVSVAFGSVLPSSAAHAGHQNEGAPRPEPADDPLPGDRPIADHQQALLELAFRAASAFPLDPHVKNRSRAQDVVVDTCLELGQARRAETYIADIADFHQGEGYADLAYHWAREGHVAHVPRYLELAAKVADANEDWRRDRVRARIAATHLLLDQAEPAQAYEAGLEVSEAGTVTEARARLGAGISLEEHLRSLPALQRLANFDHMRNALGACVAFFDRLYADEAQRARAEEAVKTYWGRLPVQIRIDLCVRLAEAALAHGDSTKALAQLDDAGALLDGATWLPEDRLPQVGRLARLRCHAGDAEGARGRVDAALADYDEQRDRIVDIYRAGALRPLAEAYQALGDHEAAARVYGRAVEEGLHNPNSRPRADDLVATCCSMARHGFQPDAELWNRMRAIQEGLGDPW